MSTITTTANNNKYQKHPIAAIGQLCSTSDKAHNLIHVAHCARLAQSQGATMLFLPECFGFIGDNATHTLACAEDPMEDQEDSSSSSWVSRNPVHVTEAILAELNSTETESGNSPTTRHDEDDDVSSRIHLLDGLRTIAQRTGLWISAGGMHTRTTATQTRTPTTADDGDPTAASLDTTRIITENKKQQRIHNTHVIMDHEGRVQAYYHKIHLFDVSIPGKVELKESVTTAPGTHTVVCDSPLGRLGLSTCYDVRFPELYQALANEGGAQILLVPSAFTVPTGAAHWHTLLQARAIETQCYVIAAAQYGQHNAKRQSFGHSLAVSPWGTVLTDAGGYRRSTPSTDQQQDDATSSTVAPDPPSIVVCPIDLDEMESIRQKMPVRSHRSKASFHF